MSVKNDKIARYTSQYWYDLDGAPKGKAKRHIHKKARAKYKQELHREVTTIDAVKGQDDEIEWEERLSREADEALRCYYYDPCDVCRKREED